MLIPFPPFGLLPANIPVGSKKGGNGMIYGGILGTGGTYAPKKNVQVSVIKHEPFESYAPQVQYAPQIGYSYVGSTYIIQSPEASVSKKASTLQRGAPSQTGSWELPSTITPEIQQKEVSGTNLPLLVGIGAVALIAFGLITRK